MGYIGEELKRERELRGISLLEISNSTKINIRLLEALEEDRFEALPDKFYLKGIIKAYAKSIGLDEDYVLNKYYEASVLQDRMKEDVRIKAKSEPAIPKKFRKRIDAVVLVIFLSAILVSLYFFLLKKEPSPLPEKPQSSQIVQKKDLVLPPLDDTAPQTIESDEIHLGISFQEETWIQLYADGERVLNGIKFPGESIEIKALKEIFINLGNAGGISYTINGKQGKRIGRSGAVINNMIITLDNYKDYLAQDKNDIEEESRSL